MFAGIVEGVLGRFPIIKNTADSNSYLLFLTGAMQLRQLFAKASGEYLRQVEVQLLVVEQFCRYFVF